MEKRVIRVKGGGEVELYYLSLYVPPIYIIELFNYFPMYSFIVKVYRKLSYL
uniref:Uncharacterized protein n=1 Tax=Virgibacillus oceani TaxID=1479511 RepID=A0A917GZ88_9BACI|nr:hypothetical protein GCM10011398_02050 [Virgibacillus oceani]